MHIVGRYYEWLTDEIKIHFGINHRLICNRVKAFPVVEKLLLGVIWLYDLKKHTVKRSNAALHSRLPKGQLVEVTRKIFEVFNFEQAFIV